MKSYSRDMAPSPDGFVPFDPAANGATNIEGNFNAAIRLDLQQGNVMAGIYKQDAAKADLYWPFTEHAFVLSGEVTVTDLASGEKRTYGPGDGWIIPQGSRTTWQTSANFVKSFFAVVQQ